MRTIIITADETHFTLLKTSFSRSLRPSTSREPELKTRCPHSVLDSAHTQRPRFADALEETTNAVRAVIVDLSRKDHQIVCVQSNQGQNIHCCRTGRKVCGLRRRLNISRARLASHDNQAPFLGPLSISGARALSCLNRIVMRLILHQRDMLRGLDSLLRLHAVAGAHRDRSSRGTLGP